VASSSRNGIKCIENDFQSKEEELVMVIVERVQVQVAQEDVVN
jgi:hypothetical protein